MASEMNRDTTELCQALCARAGMLIEDASAKVLLVGDFDSDGFLSAIREARIMMQRAEALLAAAGALIGN